MILNIYGVTTKILANGNLEQKLDIFINKFFLYKIIFAC